jgi:hypothetical protein
MPINLLKHCNYNILFPKDEFLAWRLESAATVGGSFPQIMMRGSSVHSLIQRRTKATFWIAECLGIE